VVYDTIFLAVMGLMTRDAIPRGTTLTLPVYAFRFILASIVDDVAIVTPESG
jgi:hypothetical protein